MILQAAKIIGSGLATIGLINLLLSLLNHNKDLLLSDIIYSKLAIKAIITCEEMIKSIPETNIVLGFLKKEIPLSILKVNGSIFNNTILVNEFISLKTKDRKKDIKKILSHEFLIAGVYLFIAPDDERYIGSCINFNDRLIEHKDQFNNRRKPTTLHLYKFNFSEYNWSPIYLTINYYKLFVYKYPHYNLSRGEVDILMAITQLLPRILEQSLLDNFPFNLNGNNKLVKFSYTNWDSNLLNLPGLTKNTAKSVDILINNKIIRTVNSIQDLLPVLGIKSRNTIFKYMNHVKGFFSPTYNEIVNIRYPYTVNLLNHEIIHRKIDNDIELKIPNTPLISLNMNLLYVFNSDLSLVNTYKSIKEAVISLNPSPARDGISIRGREIAISRAKNKQKLVFNQIGSFYFAENPNSNRWNNYIIGKYPFVLKDVVNNSEISFRSIGEAQKYFLSIHGKKPDVRTIKSHYIKGTLYKKQYYIIPL